MSHLVSTPDEVLVEDSLLRVQKDHVVNLNPLIKFSFDRICQSYSLYLVISTNSKEITNPVIFPERLVENCPEIAAS
jgi:hypothetical protein